MVIGLQKCDYFGSKKFFQEIAKMAFTTVRTHKSNPKVWESKRPDIASTLFNFEYDKNIFIEILTVIYKSLKT